jgi:hypothetical protein
VHWKACAKRGSTGSRSNVSWPKLKTATRYSFFGVLIELTQKEESVELWSSTLLLSVTDINVTWVNLC